MLIIKQAQMAFCKVFLLVNTLLYFTADYKKYELIKINKNF